ncbi:MAG: outer membrane protein transport protein [Gammaproteobacteria bacterium]|nr:outer membrane protein transport protein [Gammaproteobacteria bacterium]MCP5137283.1 outer membrane protein transport protein [Gammaproteobacteria bacterium]
MRRLSSLAPALTCSVTLLAATAVQAGGFRLPDVSAVGVAVANALVANPNEDGAIPINPAAMSFLPGNGVVAGGAMLIDFGTEVTRTGTTVESDSNPWAVVPSFYVAHHIPDSIFTVGLNINAPFGLATRWPAGTFAATDPTLSRLRMVSINPNVSARIGDHTAISIGPAHYRITDIVQDSATNAMSGTGDKTGYQIGLMHVEQDWSVGLSYRSQITVPVEGRLNRVLPIGVDFQFPELLQVGGRYQVNDKLAIEYDIERVGWSAYKDSRIINQTTGATVSFSTHNWRDTTTHRLGLTYKLNDSTDLMFGYLDDQNPQPESRFSPRLPALDYQGYSVGVGYKIGQFRLVGSYQFLDFKDRDINNSAAFGTYGTDGNGTAIYNGKYASYVHQVGLGLSASF